MVSFLVSDEIFQLWVNDSPEASLLDGPFAVLAVEKSDVEDPLCIIAPMIKQLLVLEV